MRTAFLGLVGVALLTSCLSPTQVTVELSTDVPCSSHPVTTIAIGAPGKAETRTPQTTTTQCTGNGQIGSIVVTPSSDNGATFEVQVVLGVGVGNPPSCGKGDNCITARREIAFVAHTPLTLPIELDQVCLGHECPANETCVAEDNKPICKSAHTGPGCSPKEPCMMTSSSSSGAGGAGVGGAGMGGMSSSSTGMGGNTCAEQACGLCQGMTSCAPVTDEPTITFKTCKEDVAPPPAQCGLNAGACCVGTPCKQTVGEPMNHCAKAIKCSGLGNFGCQKDQWDATHTCTGTDVPVKAGFLNLQVNTCLENLCTGCNGTDHVCIPALIACCTTGAPKVAFVCVKRDEECCMSTQCTATGDECVHLTGSDELRCAGCVANGASSSTGGP
jgi:hypothetical protein